LPPRFQLYQTPRRVFSTGHTVQRDGPQILGQIVFLAGAQRFAANAPVKVAPRGGEILKFIGDAALVLWPIGPDGDAAGACNAAIDAACDLTRSLAADGELRGGLALHRGEVAYGNIGAAERLDFTVIGTAVNIASRLEGLCGTLGQPWLVSEAVARHASAPLQARGAHSLKGVPEPVAVFGPVEAC
jgi:adenylate cyclase